MGRIWFLAILAFSVTPPLAAQGSCAGEACAVVTLGADGCQWTNKGSRAVRISVQSSQVTLFVTVLGPGDTFKQSDRNKCLEAGGDRRFEASFPALRPMPDEVASVVRPRPKPALPAQPAPAAATDTASGAAIAPQPIAAATADAPLPRSKPATPAAYPPAPKQKPAGTVAGMVTSDRPNAVAALLSGPACVEGDKTCPPILFKVIDSCLWVLNLNPRPVVFEALVGGRMLPLALEAANGDKADARAVAAAGGGVSNADTGLHMRLRDPFQSAGSGIPIFRARLGGAGGCVKARSEVAEFTARYGQ